MDRFDGAVARIDGRILKRGFWLYVWEISDGRREVLYVGRTGDSSSNNAASPFSRFGQHLDFRANAKGNALLKNLRSAGIDPTRSTFELFAVGPLFLEQRDTSKHQVRRDKVAALECALAGHLRELGYDVLGSHYCNKELDRRLYRRLLLSIKERFPRRMGDS